MNSYLVWEGAATQLGNERPLSWERSIYLVYEGAATWSGKEQLLSLVTGFIFSLLVFFLIGSLIDLSRMS